MPINVGPSRGVSLIGRGWGCAGLCLFWTSWHPAVSSVSSVFPSSFCIAFSHQSVYCSDGSDRYIQAESVWLAALLRLQDASVVHLIGRRDSQEQEPFHIIHQTHAPNRLSHEVHYFLLQGKFNTMAACSTGDIWQRHKWPRQSQARSQHVSPLLQHPQSARTC